jgi:hypothetical protein
VTQKRTVVGSEGGQRYELGAENVEKREDAWKNVGLYRLLEAASASRAQKII